MSEPNNRQHIERILADAKHSHVSRREFMSNAAAAGVTISAAATLWSTRIAAAEPRRGGTFRAGIHDGNSSDTHDTGTYLSYAMIQLAHTHRSYLTMITPTNELGPDIAESWEASDDATEWTFKLNRRASFHSGKAFTADDAIASLNHHRGENTTSAAKALLKDVVDIVKNDNHSITVKLASGNADLPWLMTDYHMAMCPANDDGTIDWRSGDGTGPYKIVSHEPGLATRLVRHDGWHGEGAYFDEVELIILTDPNARQTALVTGNVDTVTQLDLKTLALLKRHPDIEIDNVPSGAAITMPMHCNKAPFTDLNVRNALKLAIDRQEIIDKIAFGTAIPGNDYHVSPSMPYWPDLPQRTYDPDQAKFLLKKSGMENLEVELKTADSVYSGAVDLCVLFAEQAKAAGINITVKRVPNDGYYSDVWLKEPFALGLWGARPTPDVVFSLIYKDDAAWNESYWQHERFNELLLQAKSELNQERRAAMYSEMCQISRDEGGTILPMFTNFVYGRRKNLKHTGQLAASWQLDGARGASRWWFDA